MLKDAKEAKEVFSYDSPEDCDPFNQTVLKIDYVITNIQHHIISNKFHLANFSASVDIPQFPLTAQYRGLELMRRW